MTSRPSDALLHRCPDQQILDEAFGGDVGTDYDDGGFFPSGMDEAGTPLDCATASGTGTWQGGRLACGPTEDGEVLLVWTDDDHRAEGFPYADGRSQADVAALYAWWQHNGAFGY